MSEPNSFVFQPPEGSKQDQDALLSTLSFQFSQVSTQQEEQEGTRLSAFQQQHSTQARLSGAATQQARRLRALKLQKRQRQISVDQARQLALGNNSEEEEEEEEPDESAIAQKRPRDDDEEMEEVTKLYRKNERKPKKKKNNIYANQIMYAEYFDAIPEDLYQNWILTICPQGKRCLVTSGGGRTMARTRGGKLLMRPFQSTLPNGSKQYRQSDICILDCVYDAVHWTFYILDVMCWRGYSIYDCDTHFRHFWLQNRVSDAHEFDPPNADNKFFRFKVVQPVPMDQLNQVIENPEEYLTTHHSISYPVDGLLFYHQQVHYQGGSTPLVGWVPRDSVGTFLSSS